MCAGMFRGVLLCFGSLVCELWIVEIVECVCGYTAP